MRTRYSTMNRSKTAYQISIDSRAAAEENYDHYKKYHIKESSSIYGSILVEEVQKCSGWAIEIDLDNGYLVKKPELRWNGWQRSFQWLWLSVNVKKKYKWVVGKTVRDHIKEEQKGKTSEQ